MGLVRIEWNAPQGFIDLRRDPLVAREIDRQAEIVTQRANGHSVRGRYGWKAKHRRRRYGAIVFTDDYRARIDNARNNTLLKALGS